MEGGGSCSFSLPDPGLLHVTAQFSAGCCRNRAERSHHCCWEVGSGAGRHPQHGRPNSAAGYGPPAGPGRSACSRTIGLLTELVQKAGSTAETGQEEVTEEGQGLRSLPPTPAPESNSDHLEQDFFFFFFFFPKRKKETVMIPLPKHVALPAARLPTLVRSSSEGTEPQWLQL